MLNKLRAWLRNADMTGEETHIVCAVSGGADSIALLFALYLLLDEMQFHLAAAHYNHHLRGEESDRDEQFVRDFCSRYEIPLTVDGGEVVPGPKGLEAAAREKRYAFLRSLPGLIATAHTADDNAETVLMHLIRGTGLKGLGGIAPVNGRIIRPMLNVTRREVDAFLDEYCLHHIEDSSNHTGQFLRNRIRHEVIPLLAAENPSFAENVSAMALRLRQDEACISREMIPCLPRIPELRNMHPSLRFRYLERFLKSNGVPEPETSHIAAVESLVFAENPSAGVDLPGRVRVVRRYDTLSVLEIREQPGEAAVSCPGITELPEWGVRVSVLPVASQPANDQAFCVQPAGTIRVRGRMTGDTLRLSGGTKSLKKLMIDRKIPAYERDFVPVLSDDSGILAVHGLAVNRDRITDRFPAMEIRMESI